MPLLYGLLADRSGRVLIMRGALVGTALADWSTLVIGTRYRGSSPTELAVSG